MDSMITAAARALAAGDPFGALNRIALRDDPPALALRGIAMAQMGDLVRARALVRSAARGFGAREALARARCVVAEGKIALVSRDLAWPTKALEAAIATLDRHGDRANAAHGRYLEARRLLLIGRVDAAEHALGALDVAALPAALRAGYELAVACIAMRRVRAKEARQALARALGAARQAAIPSLMAEIESASRVLDAPAARRVAKGGERELRLGEVEAVLSSKAFVVDACRYVVREGDISITLARRPVLLMLARMLAEEWPADVSRDALVARAFRGSGRTNRIVRGFAWRWAACARCWRALPRCAPRSRASRWSRGMRARSSCSRVRSRSGTRRCSRSSRTASPGPARRWRSRSEIASAMCKGPSTSWPRPARWSRWGRGAPAAG